MGQTDVSTKHMLRMEHRLAKKEQNRKARKAKLKKKKVQGRFKK